MLRGRVHKPVEKMRKPAGRSTRKDIQTPGQGSKNKDVGDGQKYGHAEKPKPMANESWIIEQIQNFVSAIFVFLAEG